MQTLLPFIPMDRRQALAQGTSLPDRTTGAALFADISGFTALTEVLAIELGRKRGAEELLRQINPIYEALIAELYRYGGSVIGFVGDAITCWFDNQELTGFPKPVNSIPRAVACALAMQEIMALFAVAQTPAGTAIELGIKVGVAAGKARRFLVGDPNIRVLEALAGDTLTRMATAEQQATTGEVLVSQEVVVALADRLQVAEWRQDANGSRFAVVAQLQGQVTETPWSPLDAAHLTEAQLQAWLLPAVYGRLQAGEQFFGDLRPVTPLFLKFGGIDYDQDEVAGEKLSAYICWVQAVLNRYEGSLLELTIGDKGSFLYTAFGALLTHEDDTARASMVALALQEPPPDLSYIGPVQIGATQGQVWTGACGSSTRYTFSVIGNSVNMAARLMAKAKPGQVLVSRRAADLAQGQIRFRDLPAIQVKGRDRLLLVAEAVVVETSSRHLSDQYQQTMVGRTAELNQLLQFMDEVSAGASRVVTLSAAAGLGKSRLIAEWAGHIRQKRLRGFLGAAQSIEQHTPYRAWRDLFSSFLGLDALTDVADRHTQVYMRVQALAPDSTILTPLLNDILNLELPDNDLTESLSAQARQQALITLLLKLCQSVAEQSPLFLILEDVHWLDAISWELALHLGRGLGVMGVPFMLLLVTRPMADLPEAAVSLHRLPYSHHLSLTTLSAAAMTTLIANHLGVAANNLPATLLTLIQGRAEGNPFFAEELLLNLQAHGVVTVELDPKSGQRRCRLQKELSQVETALPDSLQGVILARIDRLPPSQQRVLKLAAVIGRSFAHPPLDHLYHYYQAAPVLALATEIAQLEESEFVLAETVEPELTYLFKHVMIREVAYETLLYEQRRPLHHTIATWYQNAHQGQEADSPYLPLLVHHYHHAEEVTLERRYTYLAGQQAAAQYANEDALTYFNRALHLTLATDTRSQYQVVWAREEVYDRLGRRERQVADLRQLTALASTLRQQSAVALRYGLYHNNVGDYSAAMAISEQAYQWAAEAEDDAGRAQALINSGWAYIQQGDYEMASQQYQHAYELAQVVTAATQIARAQGGLGGCAFRQGEYATASHYHQQALQLRQEIDDRPGQMQSWRNLGQVANAQGAYETALNYYLQALPLAQQIGHRPNEGRLLLDLGVSNWRQGAYAQAEVYLQQSLALAQTTGDRLTAAASLRNMGVVAWYQGQYDQARSYYEQSLLISQEIGNRAGEGKTLLNLGVVASKQGAYDKARGYYEQSLGISQEIGDRARVGLTLNNLGFVAWYQGQYEQAIGYYEQSLVIAQEIGDRAGEGLTLSNLGLVAAGQRQYDQARDYYEQSLITSQEIGGRAMVGMTLNNLGALALAQSAFLQAQKYYQQALTIRQELNQPQYLVEDWAGLALVAWRQGEIETAQTYIDQLLPSWADNPTFQGAVQPMRAFHFTWQVCQGLGLAQADEVLAAAVAMMQKVLAHMPDPEVRAVYLGQVHHQEMWVVWQAQKEAK